MLSPDHPLSPENPLNPLGLRDFSLEKAPKTDKTDINALNQDELLALRSKIDAKLTGVRLSDVNLERETLIQFQLAKNLQQDAGNDSKTPVNQRAQVQNSIAGILTTLAKMQMELHDSESLKRLKVATIKAVREQPKEFQDRFFELLEHEFKTAEEELTQ